MRIALNGATTLLGTLEQDIEAAVASGYDGLEIWLPKLNQYLEHGSLRVLRERLARAGLARLTINSLERFNFNDPSGHQRMLVDAERLCRLARALGVETVVVVPSPSPAGAQWADVLSDSVRSLSDLLKLAERYGVNLGLEFLGFESSSIRTVRQALEIVRRLGHHRLGVVVDTFHLYVGGSDPADLRELEEDELVILHINDVEPGPRESLTDDKRLYPGLGVAPLGEIRDILWTLHYDGFVSVEVFRPEYWALPAREVAAEAMRHTRALLYEGRAQAGSARG